MPIRIGGIELTNNRADWLVFLNREYGGGIEIAWWAVGEGVCVCWVGTGGYFLAVGKAVAVGIGIVVAGAVLKLLCFGQAVPVVVLIGLKFYISEGTRPADASPTLQKIIGYDRTEAKLPLLAHQ